VSIKRWKLRQVLFGGLMTNDDNGEFVRHTDYASLQADFTQMTAWGRGLETELRIAKEEIADLKERVRVKFEKIEDPMDEYLNHALRKTCAKLESENAELKNQIEFYKCKLNADPKYDVLLWKKFLDDLDKFSADSKDSNK